ncbi:MAG: sigma-70 family RNA polymerase sigma factor [Deltaproteobacteria bacterium]|nr:sigma-70 family RNA polymerase sigma factor [Deltaproteobacteria bacterium]
MEIAENIIEENVSIAERDDLEKNNSFRRADQNILLRYFQDIKRWNLLSRKQEEKIAKALTEVNQCLRTLNAQWCEVMLDLLDAKKVKGRARDLVCRDAEKGDGLVGMLLRRQEFKRDIAELDNALASGRLSAYKAKKMRRQKTELLIEVSSVGAEMDLLKLYQTGAVKDVRALSRKRVHKKQRLELIRILRDYQTARARQQHVKELLARANLRLVISIAKRYANYRGMPLLDLIQEGNIGLMKAIGKFDYRLGNRLSTYASWWIRQSIIRSIEEKGSLIRVPVYVLEKIKKANRDFSGDASEHSDAQEAGERSEGEGMDAGYLRSIRVLQDPVSLDAPVGDDETNLNDCIPEEMPCSPLDNSIHSQLLEQTEDVLATLSPRDEEVLRLRFGIGVDAEHTLQEVGEKLGVSRERIRQLEVAALAKIRHSHSFEVLRGFLRH